MISTIFSYFILGISLSAPVGPINAAQINKGIKNGFLNAWLVGVGAMMADVIMMLLIYLGLASVFTIPSVKLIMWIFGFIILCYLGYDSIKSASATVEENIHSQDKETPFKSFISGFLIAISNPLNIIFWVGIYGSVLTSAIDKIGKKEALIYSIAIFVGITCWDLFMATLVHFGRKRLKSNVLKWVSILAGIFLIGFGLTFGYQAIISIISLLF
ncbi:LysE family transporter [Priestia megaterium]|uniref:LysE family transporter n=1 Tax=Priestia megaterium TaxID=1404 RepID=UPI00207AEDEB|nr:LysE family transporter [Priestia megaterium]USL45550.1 LysE family translocator [Priestia megaterium]